MLFATVNGEKTQAIPKTTGTCPCCERSVFSKCGEVNVWHWAHHKDESCDSWYEPETEWHKNWKLAFGKENCEIVISKAGKRHIADIQTKGNVIIELQNSPIQKPIIRQRETFYGERMIWIINGISFKENFNIYKSHLDEEEEYYRLLVSGRDSIGKAQQNSRNKYRFTWNWYRRSWDVVQRYVFIDFGGKNLFWVKTGMGTSSGRGIHVSKQRFIVKYGGNLELLSSLIHE